MTGFNHGTGLNVYPMHMSASALQAWISLYLAVGICAGLCAAIAAALTVWEIWRGSWRPALATAGDLALALPRIWWHWQRRYLTGMPVMLGIALLYAHELGFTRLLLID